MLYSTKGTMENLGTLVNKSVYPRARVSPFPGHITVARIIVEYITHITRVLKAAGAELCQNACGVVNEQKTFCSHQYSSESRWINSERIYLQTRVSSLPGLVSVARVNYIYINLLLISVSYQDLLFFLVF